MTKVSELRPAPYNPRKISDKQLAALRKSLLEFGDLSGVVFNRRTGRLVGGHQRIKTFDPSWQIVKDNQIHATGDNVGTVATGYIDAPFGRIHYREVDWDEKKEAAANIAANKHGGEWDIPKLKDVLSEIDDGAFDMDLTGFDADELKSLVDYSGKAGIKTDKPADFEEETRFRAKMTPEESERVRLAMKQALGDLQGHLDRDRENGVALVKLAEFYLTHYPGNA